MTSDSNCQQEQIVNGNSHIKIKSEEDNLSSNHNSGQNSEFSFLNIGSPSQDDSVKVESDSQSELEDLEYLDVSNSKYEEFSPVCHDRWPSASWPDGSRRSAFQPYKPTTVLTNLQRGNIKTETLLSEENEISWYEQAGLGDLTTEHTKEAGIDLDTPDENGLNALMWASAYGQTRTVNMLVSNGADVNYIGTTGETALLLAAAGGHLGVIKSLLLHNADVNHEDFTSSTALMYAAHGDHPHAVHELLLRGAFFSTVNSNGDTAYSIAIQRDCFLDPSDDGNLVTEMYITEL